MITIQVEVFTIIIITVILIAVLFYLNKQIKKADPLQTPKGGFLVASILVTMVDDMVTGIVNKKYAKWLGPYIGTIGAYIFFSNIIGLFGIEPPTANFSVTLTLALMTWVLIQWTSIKESGFGGYLKGFFEPMPLFLPMNIFGTIGPLISMSLRLFGNILSGGIIMSLLHTFTTWVSSLIPVIGKLDFLGIIISVPLHAYFDLFAGLIQMFIFIMLTMVFIGNNVSEEDTTEIQEEV